MKSKSKIETIVLNRSPYVSVVGSVDLITIKVVLFYYLEIGGGRRIADGGGMEARSAERFNVPRCFWGFPAFY